MCVVRTHSRWIVGVFLLFGLVAFEVDAHSVVYSKDVVDPFLGYIKTVSVVPDFPGETNKSVFV